MNAFWNEIEKVTLTNPESIVDSACRNCQESHWYTTEDGEGYRMHTFCKKIKKTVDQVEFCSTRSEMPISGGKDGV